MSDAVVLKVWWRLADDGGGEVVVTRDYRSSIEDEKYVFDGLDELPASIAEAIRNDGRREGTIPPAGS